jgi:hypothetical protein
VAQAYNLSTWEAEAGGLQIHFQILLSETLSQKPKQQKDTAKKCKPVHQGMVLYEESLSIS